MNRYESVPIPFGRAMAHAAWSNDRLWLSDSVYATGSPRRGQFAAQRAYACSVASAAVSSPQASGQLRLEGKGVEAGRQEGVRIQAGPARFRRIQVASTPKGSASRSRPPRRGMRRGRSAGRPSEGSPRWPRRSEGPPGPEEADFLGGRGVGRGTVVLRIVADNQLPRSGGQRVREGDRTALVHGELPAPARPLRRQGQPGLVVAHLPMATGGGDQKRRTGRTKHPAQEPPWRPVRAKDVGDLVFQKGPPWRPVHVRDAGDLVFQTGFGRTSRSRPGRATLRPHAPAPGHHGRCEVVTCATRRPAESTTRGGTARRGRAWCTCSSSPPRGRPGR